MKSGRALLGSGGRSATGATKNFFVPSAPLCGYNGRSHYVMELADPAENPKSECQNPKEARNPNAEASLQPLRALGFGLHSSFDIRHSELYVPRTLKHDLRTRGALPVAECIQIALSLTRALEHLDAHGLVHPDSES